VAGAGIDDDEGTLARIDLDALGGDDPGEEVVDRTIEPAAIDDELGFVVKDVRGDLGGVCLVLGGALAHDVEEKDPALPSIDPVFCGRYRCRQTAQLACVGHLDPSSQAGK
jgi:hypothetical protein